MNDAADQLDSLRGASAIIVVAAHSAQAFLAPLCPGSSQIAGLLAQSAVMIFFVLSGFLVTTSIRRNIDREGRFDVGGYACARFDRIYPPMVFALVLTVLIWLAAPSLFPSGTVAFIHPGIRPGLQIDWTQFAGTLLIANGFLTRNISANGALWSLAFEVWFYVIAGLIACRSRTAVMVACAIGGALGALDHLFVIYAAIWAAGAAVALRNDSRVSWGLIAMAACLASFLATAFALTAEYDYLVAFNVCVGLTFACGLSKIIDGQLRIPIGARSAAAFSYTLYLTHFPLLLLTFGIVQPFTEGRIRASIIAALAFIALAIAFARALGPWVESIRPARLLAGLGGQTRPLQAQRA